MFFNDFLQKHYKTNVSQMIFNDGTQAVGIRTGRKKQKRAFVYRKVIVERMQA